MVVFLVVMWAIEILESYTENSIRKIECYIANKVTHEANRISDEGKTYLNVAPTTQPYLETGYDLELRVCTTLLTRSVECICYS